MLCFYVNKYIYGQKQQYREKKVIWQKKQCILFLANITFAYYNVLKEIYHVYNMIFY